MSASTACGYEGQDTVDRGWPTAWVVIGRSECKATTGEQSRDSQLSYVWPISGCYIRKQIYATSPVHGRKRPKLESRNPSVFP